MMHRINTGSECPSLDSSFSRGDSASPSPSSSFLHRHDSMTPSMSWVQSLSSQSAGISPPSAAPSLRREDAVSQMDIFMPQDDFACTDMLDGMSFFGDGSDLGDIHQISIQSGLPKDCVEVNYTDYRLAPYETSFQQNMPTGLGFQLQSDSLPATAYNPSLSQQIFDNTETRPRYLSYFAAEPCTTGSMDKLPLTVVPSQTVTEPMTPSSGRDGSSRCPSSTRGSESPMDSLMGDSPLMTPSTASSPAGKVSTRFLGLTIQSGRPPTRPRRIIKRGSSSAKKSLDERIPLLIPEHKEHECEHFECRKDGKPLGFKRLEHLKRHNKSVHEEEKPFQCKYAECLKAFPRGDNFRQHMNTHARTGGRNEFHLEEYLRFQKEEEYKKFKRACRRSKL